MDGKRLQNFREGKFKAVNTDLNKLKSQVGNSAKVLANIHINEYFRYRCNSPLALLQKFDDLSAQQRGQIEDESEFYSATAILQYNRGVLLYQTQQYGLAMQVLSDMHRYIEAVDDYLGIKISILLAECYVALEMDRELDHLLNGLIQRSTNIFTNIYGQHRAEEELKEDIEISPPISIASYIFEHGKSVTSISWKECNFITSSLKCKALLLTGDKDGASRIIPDILSNLSQIQVNMFPPELGPALLDQLNVIQYYLRGHIAYLSQDYINCLRMLMEAQATVQQDYNENGRAHPSCQPGHDPISHPIYYYNNVGCIHLRMGRKNLANMFLLKAFNAISQNDPPSEVQTNRPLTCITHYSSQRRCELLYNLALSLLATDKPQKAMECFQDCAGLMNRKPIYWYRIAQCCTLIHLANLKDGQTGMLNDLIVSNDKGKIVLPCRELYNIGDEEDSKTDILFSAVKCLKNAIVLDTKKEYQEACLLLLAYTALNVEPQLALQSSLQLQQLEISEETKFMAATYQAYALLILGGKTKQARDAVQSISLDAPMEFHGTLCPTAANFLYSSSKVVTYLNMSSIYLQLSNVTAAQQALSAALTYLEIKEQDPNGEIHEVPSPLLHIAIYIAMRLGNQKLAADLVERRMLYNNISFTSTN